MKLALLVAAAAFLAVAQGAVAIDEQPLLDIVYENAASVSACVATSVSGSVGVSVHTDPEPGVDVSAPTITPPTPACLVLPPL